MSLPSAQAASSQVAKTFKKHAEPIKAFASATKTCAVSSTAYGECMLARYTDVQKGMCADEFRAFKECVQKEMGRRW